MCKALSAAVLAASLSVMGGCFWGTGSQPQAAAPEEPAPPQNVFKEISLRGQGTNAIVLMYHDVMAERGRDTLWYDSTTDEVKRDVERLQEWGATFVSLEDLHKALVDDRPLPPRAVAITYDDSYQGFYDHAWPIYKEMGIPVAMFVHTNFIGSEQGRPKMTKETLKELSDSGLVTIGSHTQSHPEDFGKLAVEKQREELTESRRILEEITGKEVRTISWPNGKFSQASLDLAKEAGYLMGFAMDSGPVWHSEGIFEILRYNPTKLEDAIKAADALTDDPLGFFEQAWFPGPVRKEVDRIEGVPMAIVRGGTPETVLVAGRESVSDLVENFGGVAGINGGFFQLAAIAATDNRMIGPSRTSNIDAWYQDSDPQRLSKLINRPFVIFTDEGVVIAPFRAAYNNEEVVRAALPSMREAFVAGAWLVHQGKARTKEQILSAATPDCMDFRRRAFLGVSRTGELIVGACTGSYSSERLARAAEAAGCYEAVLLDSGFSTSLVFNREILASGHATKDKPSRPVPHAIIIKGSLEGASDAGTEGTLGGAVQP